jgi:hypothetical protein
MIEAWFELDESGDLIGTDCPQPEAVAVLVGAAAYVARQWPDLRGVERLSAALIPFLADPPFKWTLG